MTTSIATMQRTEAQGGVASMARRLGQALAALGDRLATWSARYYEAAGIGEELEALPPGQQIEAALRWHERHGRTI